MIRARCETRSLGRIYVRPVTSKAKSGMLPMLQPAETSNGPCKQSPYMQEESRRNSSAELSTTRRHLKLVYSGLAGLGSVLIQNPPSIWLSPSLLPFATRQHILETTATPHPPSFLTRRFAVSPRQSIPFTPGLSDLILILHTRPGVGILLSWCWYQKAKYLSRMS